MFIVNQELYDDKKCKYLDSEEDHWRTTIYPVCKCKMKHCNEYNGYCPIKDDKE